MAAASFNASTYAVTGPGGAVSGSLALSGATVTFTPAGALANSTAYTVTIAGSVTDTAGIALGSPVSWSFTTAAVVPFAVTSASPNGNAVPVNTLITVTFNRAPSAGSLTSASYQLLLSGSPVAATISGAGSTATLTPAAPLNANTAYSVAVATSVSDTSGVRLTATYTWSFTTAATAGPGGGLLAYWNFNEGAGGSAADSSGNGSTAVLAAGALWGVGRSGSALRVNNGANANVGSPTVLRNLSAFTWSVWTLVEGEVLRGYGPVIEKGSGSDVRRTFSVGPVSSSAAGSAVARVRAGTSSAVSYAVPGTYTPGTWVHWAVTYNDAGDRKVHIYRNGVEVTYSQQEAAVGSLSPDADVPMAIGATPNSGFNAFNGRIDEIRIYNRVLSLAEIQALAQ
jgi:hypothetical protein